MADRKSFYNPTLGAWVFTDGTIDRDKTDRSERTPTSGYLPGTKKDQRLVKVKPPRKPITAAAKKAVDTAVAYATKTGDRLNAASGQTAAGGHVDLAHMSKPQIMAMQRFLKAQGYKIGPVDGLAGKLTLGAKEDWERIKGSIGPDGKAVAEVNGPRNPKAWNAKYGYGTSSIVQLNPDGSAKEPGKDAPPLTAASTTPPADPPDNSDPKKQQIVESAIEKFLRESDGRYVSLPAPVQQPDVQARTLDARKYMLDVSPFLTNVKDAGKQAANAYDVPLAQVGRDITQQGAQGRQNQSDIAKWFDAVLAQNTAGRKDGDAFLKTILADNDAAAKGLAANLGDDAAKAALGSEATIMRGNLSGLGVNQHNYMDNMQTALALRGADERTRQSRLDDQALADLIGKRTDLQTERGNKVFDAEFSTRNANNATRLNAASANNTTRLNIADSNRQARERADQTNYSHAMDYYDRLYKRKGDTFTLNQASDKAAYDKAYTMLFLQDQMDSSQLDLMGKVLNLNETAARTAAYGTKGNIDLTKASDRQALRTDLVNQITQKNGTFKMRPAQAAKTLQSYMSDVYGLDWQRDPQAAAIGRSALDYVLHNGGKDGGYAGLVKVAPNGLGFIRLPRK